VDTDTSGATAILAHRVQRDAPVVVPLDDRGPWPVHQGEIEAGLEELEAAVKAVNEANAALLELMRRLLYKSDQGMPTDFDALASVLRH
jgi:hypothetical protein